MLTNKLNIVFECTNLDNSCTISIRDRQHAITNDIVFGNDQTHTVLFDLDFPNRLFFDVTIPQDNTIRLKQIILSGLELNTFTLDQVCNFQPIGATDITVTRVWGQSGTVFVDFFAQDWIQYHLLCGNKINKR